MKKLFTIITLLMSSFFLFSINEVSADTIDYIIRDEEFEILETQEFKELREKAIEYCEANDKYYFIGFSQNNFNISAIRAFIIDKGDYKLSNTSAGGTNFPIFSFGNITYYKYKIDNGSFILDTTSTYEYLPFWYRDSSSVYHFSYIRYFDTNIELMDFESGENTINLTYNDFTYSVNVGDHFPSLYEFNKLMNSSGEDEPVVSDKFIEDKEMMNNFYSTIFTKVGDLATSFASNYIFLLILGIFILIFVFELIWRRFI